MAAIISRRNATGRHRFRKNPYQMITASLHTKSVQVHCEVLGPLNRSLQLYFHLTAAGTAPRTAFNVIISVVMY